MYTLRNTELYSMYTLRNTSLEVRGNTDLYSMYTLCNTDCTVCIHYLMLIIQYVYIT